MLGTGMWLFRYFSPSPHMLLEITIAMPLVGLGGVLASGGLLGSRQQLPRALSIAAAMAFTISLIPLGLWVILVGMAWASSR